MATVPFDFGSANFDAAERGFVGTTSIGPIVKLRIGLGLLRAIYEYRNSGLAIGDLSAADPVAPSVNLAAMNANTRITLLSGMTEVIMAADPVVTASCDRLTDDVDDVDCAAIAIDGAYTSGVVACPEIKTWCEALGGTYTSEL